MTEVRVTRPTSIRDDASSGPSALDIFCTPLPLAAVALLAINDHWLKGGGIAPGWLTGKLSDFAGLFFFPLFLAAILSLGRPLLRPLPLAFGCAALTALLFSAIKLSKPASDAYESALAAVPGIGRSHNVRDPSDLWALPAALFSVFYSHHARRRVANDSLERETP